MNTPDIADNGKNCLYVEAMKPIGLVEGITDEQAYVFAKHFGIFTLSDLFENEYFKSACDLCGLFPPIETLGNLRPKILKALANIWPNGISLLTLRSLPFDSLRWVLPMDAEFFSGLKIHTIGDWLDSVFGRLVRHFATYHETKPIFDQLGLFEIDYDIDTWKMIVELNQEQREMVNLDTLSKITPDNYNEITLNEVFPTLTDDQLITLYDRYGFLTVKDFCTHDHFMEIEFLAEIFRDVPWKKLYRITLQDIENIGDDGLGILSTNKLIGMSDEQCFLLKDKFGIATVGEMEAYLDNYAMVRLYLLIAD
jgi:hypothetical protein